jgi:hypothetical protein
MKLDELNTSWPVYLLVASGCLVGLVVGSALILRWRAVGGAAGGALDVESGKGRESTEVRSRSDLRGSPRATRHSSRLSSGSGVSAAGGSARPM